jgi:alcohol dehydrogenase class IV
MEPLARFEFSTATRILFGPGTVREVASLASSWGKRALVVTGASSARAQPVLDDLSAQGIETALFPVSGEPSVESVLTGLRQAREVACEVVIGLGGGSVLDTGKAIAALLTNGGDVLDYLEVVGRGQALTQPSAPYVAIPTTAGTGSEVTRNAVLSVPEQRLKVSLRSPLMLPRVAVVDPELTYALPPSVTASTGLDTLTQLVEPFVPNSANPLTDAICREGMRRAARSLRRAYATSHDAEARADMALASLFGGLALANAKLGAVHGFAAPIGGMFPAPHGAICARLLPLVMEANLRALGLRAPRSPALARYTEVARLLTGRADATAAEGVAWVHDLCAALAIAPLSAFGMTGADLLAVVSQAQKASSMKGNPIPLTDEEATNILRQAL